MLPFIVEEAYAMNPEQPTNPDDSSRQHPPDPGAFTQELQHAAVSARGRSLVSMYVFTGWFSDLRWNTVQNTLMFLMLGVVAAMERDLCNNIIVVDEGDFDQAPELVANYPAGLAG